MKIGIDIDNTICNTSECVLNYVNQKIGTNLCIKDIKEYYMERFIPEEHKHLILQAFHDKEMWKNVSLFPTAKYYIDKLTNEGYDIYFVTATTFANIDKKSSFLKRNFPRININDKLINIKYKQLLNLDIMIDDFLENLIGERTYYSICLDYAWNQTNELIPCFSRATGWNDIYNKVKMVENLLKENENDVVTS